MAGREHGDGYDAVLNAGYQAGENVEYGKLCKHEFE